MKKVIKSLCMTTVILSTTVSHTMFNGCKSNAAVISPISQEETEYRASYDELYPSEKIDDLFQPEQTSTKKSQSSDNTDFLNSFVQLNPQRKMKVSLQVKTGENESSDLGKLSMITCSTSTSGSIPSGIIVNDVNR